jgi:hypothetical protein
MKLLPHLGRATVRVSHKTDRGWMPKAYKEREIPIPPKLVKSLKALKAKAIAIAIRVANLVFPAGGCNPKLDFLDCLKTVAARAKLDEDNFWLHKFSFDVSNAVPVGSRRPSHRTAVAGAFRHGIDGTIFEAVTQPACTGQGKRDFR